MQSHKHSFAKRGLIGALAYGFICASLPAQSKPTHLECESLTTPLGMDATKPVVSWKLEDATPGARQTAYEIQVASTTEILASGKPDVWDSGKVESGDSIGVTYAGPALVPSKRYFWRVQVWAKDGKAYPTSDVSWWETGLQ